MTLPTDYANATVSLDNHPDAHNETNVAVNALDARVVVLEETDPEPAGATILTGAGAPTTDVGAAGNYYLDTVARVLYGPKAPLGTAETITIGGAADPDVTSSASIGPRVTFGAAGSIVAFRYYRMASMVATVTIWIWNAAGAWLGEVQHTPGGTGWFEVACPTPFVVAASDVRTMAFVTVASPYKVQTPSVTNTTNVTFGGFYTGTPTGTFPNSSASPNNNAYLVPVFVAGYGTGPVWPIAVGGLSTFIEQVATPTNPAADTAILTYCKANKIVYAFNNSGTMRYKSLAMDAAGVTWVDHGSTAP